MSRVSVYSKYGNYIGDLRVATVRSWTKPSTGVIGECSFDISRLDEHTAEKFLGFGNFVLVRDNQLPDWCGVIYTPQDWSHFSLTVTAYQLPKILEWRRTIVDQKITGKPGEIFREVLGITNAWKYNEKPIVPGNIFLSNSIHEETMGDSAYKHIQQVAGRTAEEFDVLYRLDVNKRLTLVGEWYEAVGEVTSRWLREGYNLRLEGNPLSVTGSLNNDVMGLSDASTEATRLSFNAVDEMAIARYGLYQTTEVHSGVTQLSTLQGGVFNRLLGAFGEAALSLTALDVDDTFSFMRIGNVVNVDYNTVGFRGLGFGLDAEAEILGMEIDDLKPKELGLIVEVLL